MQCGVCNEFDRGTKGGGHRHQNGICRSLQ